MPSYQTHTDWRTVWVIFVAGVACAYNLGKVAIAAPHLQSELGLSLAAVGSLGATFAVIGALGSIAAGSVVARAGDRRMLILGLLVMTTGAAAAVPTNNIVMLMIARTVEGLGFLLITVSGPTVIARITHEQDQGKALALWSCFMPSGMALAMLTGPWFNSWREIWIFTAVLTTMIAVLVMQRVPPLSTRPSVPATGARLSDVLGSVPLAMIFLFYSLMFFALFSFLPVLLEQRIEASPTTVGMLAALACIANVLGNLCSARILKQVSRYILCLWGAIVMGVCAPVIFLPMFGPIPTLALCLLFSAVGGLIPASLLSAVPRVTKTPSQTALSVGLLMQGSNMGVALGPLLVGRAVDGYGWSSAAVLVVAWAAAMASISRWHINNPALKA